MSYIRAINWFKENFSDKINTSYSLDFITAIAVKETSFKWLNWIDILTPEKILQRCVFDASGDVPGTFRTAFPRNRHDFEFKYGTPLTEMLIYEANLTRVLPQPGYPNGFKPAEYLYKGYGLFQYDLQNIEHDKEFFENKLWYNLSDCLDRLIKVLDEKRKVSKDLKTIAKLYNGSGEKAEKYSEEVMTILKISEIV